MTPLHQLGDILRRYLMLVPIPAVRFLFVGSLVVLLIWVMRLPRSATAPPGGATRWDENLKYGATLALVIQIAVYCFL